MSLLSAIASSRRRAVSSYDADAASYFTAVEAVSTIGTTAKNAVNALIVGLKTDGLWTMIHELYLYAGPNTLAGALVKARGSGTRLNFGFVSGDFSPTLGLQGGQAKHINNGFLANSLSNTSHSIFIYSSSGIAVSGDQQLSGAYSTSGETTALILDAYASYVSGRAFRSGTYTAGNFPALTSGLITSGSVMGSRTSSSLSRLYQNGSPVAGSSSVVNPVLPNLDIFSFSRNTSGTAQFHSSDRRQIEIFAQGLNDTQAGQLHNRVTDYVNALNY